MPHLLHSLDPISQPGSALNPHKQDTVPHCSFSLPPSCQPEEIAQHEFPHRSPAAKLQLNRRDKGLVALQLHRHLPKAHVLQQAGTLACPRCQGAGVVPRRLSSAPGSRCGRGGCWGESTLPRSAPTTRGWTPTLVLLSPCPGSPCSERAHPLPPRRLIWGRPRTGISRRGSRILP